MTAEITYVNGLPDNGYLMKFLNRLKTSVRENRSLLCVGLDPNLDLLPASLKASGLPAIEQVREFCLKVIDSTRSACAAYKPNIAFFEALGPSGIHLFEEILKEIPDDKVIIADAKRGDIDSTSKHYKKAFFDYYDVDALTLNPLMGFDTLAPFLEDEQRAVYTLVLTSNPGSADLLTRPFEGFDSLSEYLATKLADINRSSSTHIGMVIGATHNRQAKPVLNAYPDACLLIPGVGTQGGSMESLRSLLSGHRGIPLISSSRSIIYAGSEDEEWEAAVEESAERSRKALMPITSDWLGGDS